MGADKTYRNTTIILIIGIVCFLLWFQFFRIENENNDPNNTELDAPDIGASAAIAVQAATAKRDKLIMRISANGRTRAKKQLTLTSQITGIINEITVKEGQEVVSGDLLLMLDDTDYALDLREAEDQLTSATIEYGLQLGIQQGHESSNSAENPLDIHSSENKLKQAKKDFAANEITRPELQLVEQELVAAKIFNSPDKRKLIALNKGLSSALIKRDKANLQFERTKFLAPFSGYIGDIKVVVGMQVTPGTDCLTLVDLNKLLIDIEILESEMAMVRVGRKAEAMFTAFPGEKFPGTVISVNPLIDPEKKTRKATIQLENRDHKIIPGMYSFVKLETQIYKDRLLVPKEAIVLRDQRPVVFIARKSTDGNLRAVWSYVDIGLKNEEYVEILSSRFDLKDGEQVVVSNHYTMIHDALIRIVE